jgi:hypothetical protein
MDKPASPERRPVVVMLHYLRAIGGDPFQPRDPATTLARMRDELSDLDLEELSFAAAAALQTGKMLRSLAWRLGVRPAPTRLGKAIKRK